ERVRNFLIATRMMHQETSLLRMPPKCPHTVIFAPTGSGKGVSLIVPFLLSCPDSAIVIDLKGENYKLTSRKRRKMGRVVVLDPFQVMTNNSDCFNPLDFIDPKSSFALEDCKDLAEALVVRKGTEPEPHWDDSAQLNIATMMALTVCEAQP